MHFGQTIGLLAALTVAVLIFRFFWSRMPKKVEKGVLLSAAVLIGIHLILAATQWGLTLPHLDSYLCWLALLGYELMLVRFSLMRPRWLTSISALILLVPLFSSTCLFPLTGVFYSGLDDIRPIGGNYILELTAWDPNATGHDGVDLGVFYSPPYAPFLRHMVQRSSFSDEQCDSKAVTVTLDLQGKRIHVHCPGHHGEQDAIHLTLPIR